MLLNKILKIKADKIKDTQLKSAEEN